ncbi:MAG: nitrilase-related carbon-nitrogen hydrolase [Candidatus Xenobia bacterium]
MKSRVHRVAMTQTVNAYRDMPVRVADLKQLEGRLEEVRRANVEHHVQLMADAKRMNVRAICFGELFTGPYFALGQEPMWLALAEDARNGPTVRELATAARQHQMIVVAPIFEHDAEQDKRFNTAVVIDEKGKVLGKFRKVHIPHGGNEQGRFLERFYYDSSDGRNGNGTVNYYPVFQTSIGRIGIAICYDRHFASSMSSLAKNGAELVFSPAVTFGAKSHRMWHLEFPTDATRYHIFIGGSNRCGAEPPWNQPYFGDSYFVGPNGRFENLSAHPNLIVAEIDFEELTRPDPSGWRLREDDV